MANFVRQSKFRHIYGQSWKREQCHDNVRVTRGASDSLFVAVSCRFVAVMSEQCGNSSFVVLDKDRGSRLDADLPVVAGHKGAILDLRFSPHDDTRIASCSEDCTAKVFRLPDDGVLKANLTKAECTLQLHQRKVNVIEWHPHADGLILTSGQDKKVALWDVSSAALAECAAEASVDADGVPLAPILAQFEFPDFAFGAAWSPDGTRVALTCKDRMLRVFDPRDVNETFAQVKAHDGAKPAMPAWVSTSRVITCGFSKMSKRQYALFEVGTDPRSTKATLARPESQLCKTEIDSSNGVLFPFVDIDTGVLFILGKGDCKINYYEITDEKPHIHYINTHMASEPQRGIGWTPKLGVDCTINEMVRVYKLHAKGLLEVISFQVPRKSETFQEDLYPATYGMTPGTTARRWFSDGDNTTAPLVRLMPNGVQRADEVPAAAPSSTAIPAPVPIGGIATIQSVPTVVPTPQVPQPPPAPSQPAAVPASVGNNNSPKAKPKTEETVAKQSFVKKEEPAAAVPPAPVTMTTSATSEVDVAALVKDVKNLKTIVKGQERRLVELSERLADAESRLAEAETNGQSMECATMANGDKAGHEEMML